MKTFFVCFFGSSSEWRERDENNGCESTHFKVLAFKQSETNINYLALAVCVYVCSYCHTSLRKFLFFIILIFNVVVCEENHIYRGGDEFISGGERMKKCSR